MRKRILFLAAFALGAMPFVGRTSSANAEPVRCTGYNQPVCDMRTECYTDPSDKYVCHTYYRYWP